MRAKAEPGFDLLDQVRVVTPLLGRVVHLFGHVDPVDRKVDLDEQSSAESRSRREVIHKLRSGSGDCAQRGRRWARATARDGEKLAKDSPLERLLFAAENVDGLNPFPSLDKDGPDDGLCAAGVLNVLELDGQVAGLLEHILVNFRRGWVELGEEDDRSEEGVFG